MPETIYNWGREKQLKDSKGTTHKVPTQKLLKDGKLIPSKIPVYHAPPKIRTISRGVFDYDPLGNS